MGSSSHGGGRKGQLGLAVIVPMSGTHLKRDEGWDPTIKGAFLLWGPTLHCSSVGSESAPHFYKSPFGSWVRALMEAKEKGQLGPAVTVPMSGTHLKRDEGWDCWTKKTCTYL